MFVGARAGADALYRLAQIHRNMGYEERAAGYEEQLRRFDPQGVTAPPDFRLAEYQARAMVGLVEDGVWERETLLDMLSHQVEQFTEGVQSLMVERVLQTLLKQWPEDADILSYVDEL